MRNITSDEPPSELPSDKAPSNKALSNKALSPGKYRHLTQCSSADGFFNILAIDHRANLLDSLNANSATPLTSAEFVAFKQQVIRALIPYATAVLTDPEFGFGAGIAQATIPGQVGLLSPLEVTDYSTHPSQRATNMIKGWSIARIKRIGASGVKLLLYYHPAAANARHQRELVEQVVTGCARYDLPFFLEPISYSLDPEKVLSNRERRQILSESVPLFCDLGVDILKLEFPLNVKEDPDEIVWVEALRELNSLCRVPWTLLSAGESYPTFKRQAELACQAGASGVIVGRAVWAEAATLHGAARNEFLMTLAAERMRELATICAQYSVRWRSKVSAPSLSADWYQSYDEFI